MSILWIGMLVGLWLAVLVLAVGLCASAKRGDRQVLLIVEDQLPSDAGLDPLSDATARPATVASPGARVTRRPTPAARRFARSREAADAREQVSAGRPSEPA